jgi:uncharacterized protein
MMSSAIKKLARADANGIHAFRAFGHRFAFDAFRLNTYELSADAFGLLQSANEIVAMEGTSGVVAFADRLQDDAKALLQSLLDAGLVRDATAVAAPRAETAKFAPYVDSIMLNVAESCNCNCTYCFADAGRYGRDGNRLMQPDTAKAAVDWLIERSGGNRDIKICFFGGEPLLNFSVIEFVVAYAHERCARSDTTFTMTTNGTLFTVPILTRLRELGIKTQVSLDGVGPLHDQHRKTKDGKGTWSLIEPHLSQLLDDEANRTVRATLATGNTDVASIVKGLLALGFDRVVLEPATGTDGGAIDDAEMEEVLVGLDALSYEYLASALAGRPMTGFHNLHERVGRMWSPRFVFSGCGAGKHYVTVAADGAIFACQQLASEPHEVSMGSVNDGSFDEVLQRRFQTLKVDEKSGCADCWAKHLCANHCAAKSLRQGRGYAKTDSAFCAFDKRLWENAIAITAILRQYGVNIVNGTDWAA